MSSDKNRNAVTGNLSMLHEIAFMRGDGLHPLLVEALTKSGSVSGPPPPSQQSKENVVQVAFGRETAPVGNKVIRSK